MAHADIDPANPPGRRIGAVVLVRDQSGRVLLVKPMYKDGWQLPGGGAHEGETIADAAARELREETGLRLALTHFVALDQVPANPETGAAEGFNVVCDAGKLTDEEASAADVPESAVGELSGLRWVSLDRLDTYAPPYQGRRVRAAVAASELGMRLPLLLLGEPTDA